MDCDLSDGTVAAWLHCWNTSGCDIRWAGAGDWSDVREKYCWLAGAGAGGWSGVRGKYCWAGAGAGCRTE